MSSYKNYNDLSGYRTRSNTGMGIFSVRNSPTSNSNLTGYRSTYSGGASITRSSLAVSVKDRAAITKSIQDHKDKLPYKFSGTKVIDKHRPNPIGTPTEDSRMKCPTLEKTSLFEKYAHSRGRITPSSVVEKYSNRIYGREKSRLPETMVRSVVNTFPGSRLKVNYRGGEKEVQSGHTPISYRPPCTSSTSTYRTFREPSPRVDEAKEQSPNRVSTRVSNYTQNTNSGNLVHNKTIIASQKIGEITITNDVDDDDNQDNNEATVVTTVSGDGDEVDAVPISDDYHDHDQDHDNADTDDDDDDDDVDDDEDDDDEDDDDDDKVQDSEKRTMVWKNCDKKSKHDGNTNTVTISVISRGTSPMESVSPLLARIRSTEASRSIQWKKTRVNQEIETKNVAIQYDWIGDTSRYSKYFSGTRLSPWPSYLDKVHSSSRVNNLGHAKHSEGLTRPLIPIGAADATTRLNVNIHLKTPTFRHNIESHHPLDTVGDDTSLKETGKIFGRAQDLPVDQTTQFDETQKSIRQVDIDSTNSVTSSNSSHSLPPSSRRESLSRSDSITISSPDKSMFSSASTKTSLNKRQLARTDYLLDGSGVGLSTGKVKSLSTSPLMNQSVKMRTPPSSMSSHCNSGRGYSSRSKTSKSSINSCERNNSEECGKPPVPKTNSSNTSTRTAGSAIKYVNKDFRKSVLNMPDAEDQTLKSTHRKRIVSNSKSVPTSPQNSTGNIKHSSKLSFSSRPRSNSEGKYQQDLKNSVRYGHVVNISKNTSKLPSSLNHGSFCSTSSSSDDSSESSTSESFEEPDLKFNGCNEQRSENGMSNSSDLKRSRRTSARTSKSSILESSADELFMTTDQLPQSISTSKSRSGKLNIKTDDVKPSMIGAHAHVANISRLNNDRSSKSTKLTHSCSTTKSITKSSSNNMNKSRNYINNRQNVGVKQEMSGAEAWWMNSNLDNVPDGVEKLNQSQEDMSEATTVSMNLPDDENENIKTWQQNLSGELSNANNTDDIASNQMKEIQSRQMNSSHTPITTSGYRNGLQHQRSGERAWWMSDDPAKVPDGIEIYPSVTYKNSSISVSTPISSHNDDIDNSKCFDEGETLSRNIHKIRHIDSGEKAWWMDSNSSIPEGIQKISAEKQESYSKSDESSESFEKLDNRHTSSSTSNESRKVTSLSRFPNEICVSSTNDLLLADRASPDGVEHSSDSYEAHVSSYDGGHQSIRHPLPDEKLPNYSHFIGNHTNIDDVLDVMTSPHYNCILFQVHREDMMADGWNEATEFEEIDAAGVIIHDSTSKTPVIQRRRRDMGTRQSDCYNSLDDTALQLYKDGDYGAYLDLEASISEQQEEFESFQTNRKNSIILRTQLSVRVHTIIEKLLNSEGRELRRALFSLKQIFQEDKDLVHEFVQNDGLACLIKVGNEADQNYQNYILRALGQVMLYVDGMNGVMEHGQTVQWLYTLIASRFRLVVKTALKLLLVFVEYVETNSLLLVRAVRSIDTSRGMIPWTNVMKLLKDYDAADTELLIYATTLINKCLNGIPDQDTYYDQVDCLEEQGIEGIIQRYMSKQGTDLDLLRQFQIYEAVLHHEDGNDRGSPIRQLDDNIRKTLRSRNCLVDSNERRKSRRHSTGTSPLPMSLNVRLSPRHNHSLGLNSINGSLNSSLRDDDEESSSSHSSQGLADVPLNGGYKENKDDVGVTPALRRRRERAERQRSFIREQQEATATMRASVGNLEEKEATNISSVVRYANGAAYERNKDGLNNKISRVNSRKDLTPLMNAANKLDSEEKKPWYGKSHDEGVECDEGTHSDEDKDRKVLVQMKRDGTVKDLTQKLAAQNLIANNTGEEKVSRIGDMSGLISKAKEGLAKSKSKADILKLSSGENVPKLIDVKKSENELHWEELVNQMKRPLTLSDLDFTDLNSDDEVDVLGPVNITNGVPPPPPPMVLSQVNGNTRAPPPPPLTEKFPPPFLNASSSIGGSVGSNRSPSITQSMNQMKSPTQNSPKKNKKTVKLFWKEVREDPGMILRLEKNTTIWDELIPVSVDTQKLEHLFESRAKDLITKEKQQEMNKNKEIIVLDHKRSNTINIGMTKLPPPRSIKTAILKMDATIMSREGIEKLLTMLPTEDERSRIQDAQAANPDVPLGSAEQFLLTLASISELPARLKLWAFKLDFENSEKEIADPLMDLKQGMETLKMNKTFRGILSTLLSIGIFLNGNEVKGFQLEYLTKVPEVKDTVHKHSLLHHLCHMVMEKFSDSTDLYSEIGAVTRASKIDFDELAGNIGKLESECKASWDHLKLIAKHDGSTTMKVKMSDFLADCAERIIVLGIVHRRVINRFHKFILWLGVPLHRVQDTKPNEFCRIVSEFALEYRTTRERVLQQLEKKANHRERNKTRGKMITEVGKFRTKEDRADAELRQLLGSDISDVESIHGTLPWRRQRKEGRTSLGPIIRDETTNGNITDGDDELLESLVKTATKSPVTRAAPRERKRTRHADLKRSRTRENNTTPEGYRP